MADMFPTTLPISGESKREFDDGRVVDRMGDGNARVLKLHDDRNGFRVVLPGLTSAQVSTLLAFKAAHELIPFDFTWPIGAGGVFSVVFGTPAIEEDWRSPLRTTYIVHLEPQS